MTDGTCYIHPTADVEMGVRIGAETRLWQHVQVRTQATIGARCNVGKGVYIDSHVHIGSQVKIQNYVSLFDGVTVEDGVFIGPHVCFTNDRFPRAITPTGDLKDAQDWTISPTCVKYGASIGAGAVIVCGVTIGAFALVGAGSVVTKDVAPHTLVLGNPARVHGYVCKCAHPLSEMKKMDGYLEGWCAVCQERCFVETCPWEDGTTSLRTHF